MIRYILVCASVVPAVAHAAPAPSWTIDKAESALTFSAAMNGESFAGRFARWDAAVRFDPEALQNSSVVALIDTASARTGDQTRDEALPTGDWFAAKTFPRATFRSTRFVHKGGSQYQAIGTLTIRGTSRPVSMPFTLVVDGRRATMRGAVAIDRRSFGIGQGQFSSPDSVAAQVRIAVSIAAMRNP